MPGNEFTAGQQYHMSEAVRNAHDVGVNQARVWSPVIAMSTMHPVRNARGVVGRQVQEVWRAARE